MNDTNYDSIFFFIVIMYKLFPCIVHMKARNYLKLQIFLGLADIQMATACCLQTSQPIVFNFGI